MPSYNEILESCRCSDLPAGTVLPPLSESGARILNVRQRSVNNPFAEGEILRTSSIPRDKITKIFLERQSRNGRSPVVEIGTSWDVFSSDRISPANDK